MGKDYKKIAVKVDFLSTGETHVYPSIVEAADRIGVSEDVLRGLKRKGLSCYKRKNVKVEFLSKEWSTLHAENIEHTQRRNDRGIAFCEALELPVHRLGATIYEAYNGDEYMEFADFKQAAHCLHVTQDELSECLEKGLPFRNGWFIDLCVC